MKLSSYKIFSIFGIDVELHWIFILFILAFMVVDFVFSLVLMVVFVFVTIHEVVHSLVSMRYGISVKKILLLPIGGMAMMDTTDMSPSSEIKMAVAGPLFNFAAAAFFFFLSSALGFPLQQWLGVFWNNPEAFSQMLSVGEILIFYAFWANFILGSFNLLIPAFPLDGGRVFRALLAMKFPYLKATEMAKYVSYVIAGLLFILGTFGLVSGASGGLWIMIIATFIAFGAAGEYRGLVLHSTLSKIKVSDVVSHRYPSAYANETIQVAIKRALRAYRPNMIIFNGEISVIDTDKLNKMKREEWGWKDMGEVMKPVKTFSSQAKLEEIFKYMNSSGNNLVPIMEKDKIIGVVYYSDIQKVVNLVKEIGYYGT